MLRRYVTEAIIILLHDNTRLHIATSQPKILLRQHSGLLEFLTINDEIGPYYIMHLKIEYT